jgi:hypothetical protein
MRVLEWYHVRWQVKQVIYLSAIKFCNGAKTGDYIDTGSRNAVVF